MLTVALVTAVHENDSNPRPVQFAAAIYECDDGPKCLCSGSLAVVHKICKYQGCHCSSVAVVREMGV